MLAQAAPVEACCCAPGKVIVEGDGATIMSTPHLGRRALSATIASRLRWQCRCCYSGPVPHWELSDVDLLRASRAFIERVRS